MAHDFDLIGYLDKTVSKAEKKRVEDHLRGCAQCRDEVKLLQKSETLFGKILARNAEVFCPSSDELVKRVTGELDLESKEDIEEHIKGCAFCQEKIALLDGAAKAKIQMPDKADWEPLPQDLLERIKQKERPLRERLRAALIALKAKGKADVSDLLDHVDDLADRLLIGSGPEVPSFALERDITMPLRSELELREIQLPPEIHMEIDKYTLLITASPSGTRVVVTGGGKPVAGIRVMVRKESGDQVIGSTDENGEILV